MDGDIFERNRGLFHNHAQRSHQSPPGENQVPCGRVQHSPINAMTDHVVIWGLWVHICTKVKGEMKYMGHLYQLILISRLPTNIVDGG